MIVTISGPIGSGKTTVCNLLSKELDIPCVISGHIFRQMAKEQNLSLAEFGKLAESDPKYDKELDERMVRIAKGSEDMILEGRLTAYMLTKFRVKAFRIYLDAPVDVRVKRVVEREGKDFEKTKADLLEREECEATRYRQYYNIDIRDKSVYDLIIDTGALSPEEVVRRIIEAVRK